MNRRVHELEEALRSLLEQDDLVTNLMVLRVCENVRVSLDDLTIDDTSEGN